MFVARRKIRRSPMIYGTYDIESTACGNIFLLHAALRPNIFFGILCSKSSFYLFEETKGQRLIQRTEKAITKNVAHLFVQQSQLYRATAIKNNFDLEKYRNIVNEILLALYGTIKMPVWWKR